MGRIYDQDLWVDNIYLIEPYDPAMGGEMGIDNLPAKQLANRTAFIKNLFELRHNGDGSHALNNEDIADDAAITEQKLSLDYATQDIYALALDAYAIDDRIRLTIQEGTGINGTVGASISKAVPLSWSYSDKTFDFEMFVDGMTLLDTVSQPLLESVAGDESLDVTDSSALTEGKSYVICNEDGTNPESFQVATILTKRRVRATESLATSRTAGIVSRTSWIISDKKAQATDGSVFYSRPIVILEDKDYGKVIIRVTDDGSVVTPYYRFSDDSEWQAPESYRVVTRAEGTVDYEYEVPGGLIEFKFAVATLPGMPQTTIHNMCVMPLETRERADTIKRPTAVYPAAFDANVPVATLLRGSTYRSLYGVGMAAAQFQVSEDRTFGSTLYDQVHDGTAIAIALPEGTLPVTTQYYWRCRYKDAEDVWSEWSAPTIFTTGTAAGMVHTPDITAPTLGTLNVARNSATFTSTAFASTTTDSFSKIQWNFSTSSSFDTVFYNTGELSPNTTYTYPSSTNTLAAETTYYARVRYKGTALGWSEWSTPVYFTTAAA